MANERKSMSFVNNGKNQLLTFLLLLTCSYHYHRIFLVDHRIFLFDHRILLVDHRILLVDHRTFLVNYRIFLVDHRILLVDHRTFLVNYRIFLFDHRILLVDHRTFLVNYRIFLFDHRILLVDHRIISSSNYDQYKSRFSNDIQQHLPSFDKKMVLSNEKTSMKTKKTRLSSNVSQSSKRWRNYGSTTKTIFDIT